MNMFLLPVNIQHEIFLKCINYTKYDYLKRSYRNLLLSSKTVAIIVSGKSFLKEMMLTFYGRSELYREIDWPPALRPFNACFPWNNYCISNNFVFDKHFNIVKQLRFYLFTSNYFILESEDRNVEIYYRSLKNKVATVSKFFPKRVVEIELKLYMIAKRGEIMQITNRHRGSLVPVIPSPYSYSNKNMYYNDILLSLPYKCETLYINKTVALLRGENEGIISCWRSSINLWTKRIGCYDNIIITNDLVYLNNVPYDLITGASVVVGDEILLLFKMKKFIIASKPINWEMNPYTV